jgi:hypothetical protein
MTFEFLGWIVSFRQLVSVASFLSKAIVLPTADLSNKVDKPLKLCVTNYFTEESRIYSPRETDCSEPESSQNYRRDISIF